MQHFSSTDVGTVVKYSDQILRYKFILDHIQERGPTNVMFVEADLPPKET